MVRDTDDFADQVAGVATLAEPVRRRLYLYVAGQGRPVTRDEAAAGTGLPRHTAKFHLDRLVADGLLEADFKRPPGRGGPGAGRPSKRYRRSPREIRVSLPERRYDLLATVLADAVADAIRAGVPVEHAVQTAAQDAGDAVAQRFRDLATPSATVVEQVDVVCVALASEGFEPRRDGAQVVLANCPFHALAHRHLDLVCGMNLALVGALARSLAPAVSVSLDPAPGRCCVTLHAATDE